ncbi:MAG: HDOD domain-containing protein [Phycisphaerae bacterium]|nr:HDOD domain-containing protein [Phycisphaerae bacterium]
MPDLTNRTPDDPRPSAFVLERLDALPTPSALAMQLLAAANDDSASAGDLVDIIRQDSALTASVIALCRRGPRGRQLDVASLDRAVVLLGFDAVRGAALAVEFVGSFGGAGSTGNGFDPLRFWRHALAKAIVAEHAAKLVRAGQSGRAFVAGLLHDLGAMSLAKAAPALFDAACDDAERRGLSLDAAAGARIGLSCAAAGARLALRWNLPEELVDAIRLRGTDVTAAQGVHRTIVLLAELADRTVCRRHIGGAGFGPSGEGPQPILDALEIDHAKFASSLETLFEDVAGRAEALQLSCATPAHLAAEAIERANRRLEAFQSSRSCGETIEDFDSAGDPAATLALIVRAITRMSGQRERLLTISMSPEGARAEVREYGPDGELLAGRSAGEGDVDGAAAADRWCELRTANGRPGKLVLSCRGAAITTIIRADGEVLQPAVLALVPTALWSFALASSIERARANRSAERTAEALRALAFARDRVVRDRALASVGEIAAGLAHEINNPLTVVSGRAQLLRRTLDSSAAKGVDEIIIAAERASTLVSQLLRSVRPSRPVVRETDASEIIQLALRFLPLPSGNGAATDHTVGGTSRIDVRVDAAPSASPACFADPAQAADALAEVIQNALDAALMGRVEVSAHTDTQDGRCVISVQDTGPGFSDRALVHALDPFFSERRSGRGAGLGLCKARSIIEATGGRLELRNAPAGGAIVTIALPADNQKADGRGEGRASTPRQRRSAA